MPCARCARSGLRKSLTGHDRRVLRVALFAVVAILVYGAQIVLSVAVSGEVSCYETCSPTSEFLNDAYPWPMIFGIALALGVAYLVARPRRQ